MHKLYTLLLAAIVIMTASATTDVQMKAFGKMPANAVKIENWKSDKSKSIKKHPSTLFKSPMKTVDEGMPIFDPEGTGVDYSVTSTRFELIWGNLVINCANSPTRVVFGDDNKVYIRDIITSGYSGVYVEGTRDGDKITVKLPQVCYSYTDEDGIKDEFLASKMEYYTFQKEGVTYMSYRNVAEDDNYLVYNIAEDGTIKLDLNHGDPNDTDTATPYIIGLCTDATPGVDDWYGYGELYQSLAPFSEAPNVLPEGIETETWGMISAEVNGYVQVGFDDDNVYITGIGDFFPDAVIIGKIEGDKVVFDAPQYLGEFDGYFVWLIGVRWTSTDWEEYELLNKLVLNYDAESKVISTDDELIDFVFSASIYDAEALDYLSNPTFMYMSEEDINASPADPYVKHFDHYGYRDYIDASEGYIEWIIPDTNVNGCLLDTERMYYNFYIDGTATTFSTDINEMFNGILTNIPYNYDDGWDVQVLGTDHYFTFKCESYKNFGLQSFYVGSDGVTYASNLVTYTPKANNGLSSINGNTLQKVEFYDMQGRLIVNPEAGGVYIMRSTFTDGTTTVSKMVRK